jgi:7,8-dihydropterin-6-yl-methyl-4-(beta-D-ribofuranosyl)aminobenzene 5'-phosphate synthase
VPTVDRLVLTNVVDNFYDVFAKAGKLDSITVQRTPLGTTPPLVAEHGLAYHLESTRGTERREILLDFSLTDLSLSANYRALGIDPARAAALVLSHGHADHYGALPTLATEGRLRRGVPLYAGGEDTFCHRVVVTPAATIDQGQLDRTTLDAHGIRVTIAPRARSWPTTPSRRGEFPA